MVFAMPAALTLVAAAVLQVPAAHAADAVFEGQRLREDRSSDPGWPEARAEIAAILRARQHHRRRDQRRRGHTQQGPWRDVTSGPRREWASLRHERLSSLDFHSSAGATRQRLADLASGDSAGEPNEAASGPEGAVGHEGRTVDPVTGEPCEPAADADDAWSSNEGGDTPKTVGATDVFGDVHPAVDRQLARSAGQINALREQQEDAEHMRQRLGHVQAEAQAHMDDALEMQRAIEGLKAEHRRQSQRITEINAKKAQLSQRHRALLSRVQEVMEPRLNAAHGRLENRKHGLEKAVQLVQERNIEREQKRVALLEALTAEKEAKIALHKAEEVAKEAERERSDTAEQLRSAKRGMGALETSLRYARARYEASLSEERTDEDHVSKATSSITSLEEVLSMEKRKLEEAFVHSQESLQGQIKEAEAARKESKSRLKEQERRYAAWQTAQKKRMEEAASDKARFDVQQRAYLDKRSDILRDAEARAGAPYGGKTSRDDWAWPGAGGGAAVGREVHLTDPLPEAFAQPEEG